MLGERNKKHTTLNPALYQPTDKLIKLLRPQPQMKLCGMCLLDKPITNFGKHESSCKECIKLKKLTKEVPMKTITRRYKILLKTEIHKLFKNTKPQIDLLTLALINDLSDNDGYIPIKLTSYDIPKISKYTLQTILEYLIKFGYVDVDKNNKRFSYKATEKLRFITLDNGLRLCSACKLDKDYSDFTVKCGVCKICAMEIMRFNRDKLDI